MGKKRGRCYICSKSGHRAKACPDAVCVLCGKKGHIKPDCPDAPPPPLDLGSFESAASNAGVPAFEQSELFTYCELFAGIGGFRIALDALGGKCVFASEIDEFAKKTYEDNFGERPAGDITKIPSENMPSFDLLVGGFPCQTWSFSGRREGFDDPRGQLFREIVRIAKCKQPKAMLLENVRGLATHDEGRSIAVIKKCLEDAGYDVKWKLIDAVDLLPQERVRVFLACVRKDLNAPFTFPSFPRLRRTLSSILQHSSATACIEDVLSAQEEDQLELLERQYNKILKQKYTQKFPAARFADTAMPARTLQASYGSIMINSQFVPASGNRKFPRRFSFRECARIMGFPESFKLHPKRSYNMLGNAVAPPVICMLSAALLTSALKLTRETSWGWQKTKELLIDATPKDRRNALESIFREHARQCNEVQ